MTVRQIADVGKGSVYKMHDFVVACRSKKAVYQTFRGFGGAAPEWHCTPPTALTLVFALAPLALAEYAEPPPHCAVKSLPCRSNFHSWKVDVRDSHRSPLTQI